MAVALRHVMSLHSLLYTLKPSCEQRQKLLTKNWRGKGHPHTFGFTEKRPVLLRADFVLTKDPKWPYKGQFRGKIDMEGSSSKAAGGP